MYGMDVEVVEILMRFCRTTHVLVDRIEVEGFLKKLNIKGSSSPALFSFPSFLLMNFMRNGKNG